MMREQSVQRVSSPFFSRSLHDVSGCGWVVDATMVRFDDGSIAEHVTYSFETESEASSFASSMRRKMT